MDEAAAEVRFRLDRGYRNQAINVGDEHQADCGSDISIVLIAAEPDNGDRPTAIQRVSRQWFNADAGNGRLVAFDVPQVQARRSTSQTSNPNTAIEYVHVADGADFARLADYQARLRFVPRR